MWGLDVRKILLVQPTLVGTPLMTVMVKRSKCNVPANEATAQKPKV